MPGSLRLEQTHFLQEPPEVDAATAQAIRDRTSKSLGGMNRLPHDLIQEITTPHIASPDLHVDDENQRIIM